MPYFPKSKVNIKEASTGEFIYREGRKPFKGKYLELSNGRYYEGTDVINLGSELVKAKEASSNNIMGNSFDAQKYSLLKKKKKKFLQNTKRIPINKTTPIEEDYNRGYYIRYFARRINQPKGYIEVNFDTVKKLQEKVDYDYNLYEVGSVTWALKNGTRKTNNNNLRLLEQTFPFISSLFPILNEFEIIDGPLTTTGGELYYEDGREYIGLYHVHPEKGPMVGAEHINEPHAFLNYSEELSSLTDNIDRTIPIPPPTPNVEVKQPPQTPLRSMLQDRTTTTRSTPSIRRTPTRRSGY